MNDKELAEIRERYDKILRGVYPTPKQGINDFLDFALEDIPKLLDEIELLKGDKEFFINEVDRLEESVKEYDERLQNVIRQFYDEETENERLQQERDEWKTKAERLQQVLTNERKCYENLRQVNLQMQQELDFAKGIDPE